MANYQITAFNPISGSITVSYQNNGETFATYNIDIPLDENNNFIVGTELDTYIINMFPSSVLNRIKALKAGISNASAIQALVVPPPVSVNTTVIPPTA
jgi:hypothetical protein